MSKERTGMYFEYCLYCCGHGHFVVPTQGHMGKEQYEVFSHADPHQQLRIMAQKRLISTNQFCALTTQVEQSLLPVLCPPDVEEFIGEFCQNESWMVRYSEGLAEEGQAQTPKDTFVDSGELALAVHEFLLGSRPTIHSVCGRATVVLS